MYKDTNIAILILAAGAASRMGSIKQLLPWKTTTLLGNAITNAKTITNNVYVVLGANAQEIKNKTVAEVTYINNSDWSSGLGSSIACGVEAIVNKGQYAGVLIMLADQPLVDVNYINKLIDLFTKNDKGIIATNYSEKIGVPVIFNKTYFKELRNLKNDFGAKYILKNYNEDIISINPNGKEKDIDTPDDYQELLKI